MNDVELIYEAYKQINEANIISVYPLEEEIKKLLQSKNVQRQEIRDWFLKTYIKWFQSPADDNIKTPFISKYTAKETDPDWARREGIFQFNNFTSEYKDRLSHLIDFLNIKIVNPKQYKDDDKSDEANEYRRKKIESDVFFKSLHKVTVPQMFEEVQKWDEEMKRSSEEAEKANLQSVQGRDYEVVGIYDGYPVWKLTSNKSFREESMYMGHCVGQAEGESQVTSVEGGESEYFKKYKQGELIIYSIRKPKEYNKPAVTFELQKDPNDNIFKIVQIKGKANKEVSKRYRKACRQFIEDNKLEVKKDGQNIGMVKWNEDFYFEDSAIFQKIYVNEIVPKQKKVISEIMSNIKNGFIESLNLENLFLRKLPDLSNVKVGYGFSCANNQLTTLRGSPREVGGIFFCHNNQLTTLEGAPQEVGGIFFCHNNQLTTLEGAPQVVGESFSCANNQLTTLRGSPREVGGGFYCDNNQLTTLEGAPQVVGESFSCENNQLTTLEGAPQKVGGSFFCHNNQLTTLEGAPQEVGGSFFCENNQLTTLRGSPREVGGDFFCHNNQLTTLEGAPQVVGGSYSCANNQLTTLEGAPQEVGESFSCAKNPVNFTKQDIEEAQERSRQRNQPRLESFKQFFQEACWKGYKQVGTKKKGKRKVPNCVKK